MHDFTEGEFNVEEFAARIHGLRKEKHLTQVDLATKAGYDNSYLSRIEDGDNTPSIEAISAFAAVLGVSTEYLMFGEADTAGVLEKLRFCQRMLKEIENRLSHRT
ncbi:MAG: helix-turn-helix domain-containing protein [Oscillospiraceae bacterium]|nr:helix-turn-helix domain-containing protein [Oscillospiraceae bacterium]